MSCGCKKSNCGCQQSYFPCPPTYPTNCPELCGQFVSTTSWNVPAIGSNAELNVPIMTALPVGSYIYNPTYGYYKIVSFDAVTKKLIITNNGDWDGNIVGNVIPAYAPWILTDYPRTLETAVTDFTATFVPVGGMTFTPTTVVVSKYKIIGDGVGNELKWMRVRILGTLSGSIYNEIKMNLPVATLSSLNIVGINENTAGAPGYMYTAGAGTVVSIYKVGAGNFALGDCIIDYTGTYY